MRAQDPSEFLQELVLVDARLAQDMAHRIPPDCVVEGYNEKALVLSVCELPVTPTLALHESPESCEGSKESPAVDLPGEATHSDVHRDDLDLDRRLRRGGPGCPRLFAVPGNRLFRELDGLLLAVCVDHDRESRHRRGVGTGLRVVFEDDPVPHGN